MNNRPLRFPLLSKADTLLPDVFTLVLRFGYRPFTATLPDFRHNVFAIPEAVKIDRYQEATNVQGSEQVFQSGLQSQRRVFRLAC